MCVEAGKMKMVLYSWLIQRRWNVINPMDSSRVLEDGSYPKHFPPFYVTPSLVIKNRRLDSVLKNMIQILATFNFMFTL